MRVTGTIDWTIHVLDKLLNSENQLVQLVINIIELSSLVAKYCKM